MSIFSIISYIHGFFSKDLSLEQSLRCLSYRLQGDGLCDKRKRPCKKVSVMGSGFLNSTNMTCHVKEFTVTLSTFSILLFQCFYVALVVAAFLQGMSIDLGSSQSMYLLVGA